MSPAGRTREPLQLATRVFRHLDPKSLSWDDWDEWRQIGGILEASPETIQLALDSQQGHLLNTGTNLTATSAGTRIPVKLNLTQLTSGKFYFARNLNELLERRIRSRFEPPQCFFLAEVPGSESGYLHPDDQKNQPELLAQYFQTLHLVDLLVRVSDYRDEHGDEMTLVFVHRGILRLPIDYSVSDLLNMENTRVPDRLPDPGSGCLDKIERLLRGEVYQDQIKDILKATLIKTLSDTEQRFVDLLQGIRRLFRLFNDDYALFISQFSFEKVREQAEEHRLTYTDKLNGLFAGIQNRLLSIPVALVIAAGGMKSEDGATFSNSMILLGAVVFAGLMLLLIANQEDTLESLHREIQREGRKIALKPDIYDKLKDVYEDLEQRYYHHRRLLRWIRLLVVISVVLPLGVFLYYIAPLLSWP